MNIWVSGPPRPILSLNEVQIWRILLPISEESKIEFQRKMSLQELTRMNNFYFQEDKDRFLAARGGLKDIVSRYLNIPAEEAHFDYGKFGKPYLKGSHLQFNLSHSAGCVLYAFSHNNSLGIDVERIKENIDYLSLAKTICSKEEYEKFLMLPKEEQLRAFYRCWTRKEAIIKMIGKGLSFPLKQLEVGFSVKDTIQLLEVELIKPFLPHSSDKLTIVVGENYCVRPEWQLEEIVFESGYVAAIAAEKSTQKISLWNWQASRI